MSCGVVVCAVTINNHRNNAHVLFYQLVFLVQFYFITTELVIPRFSSSIEENDKNLNPDKDAFSLNFFWEVVIFHHFENEVRHGVDLEIILCYLKSHYWPYF